MQPTPRRNPKSFAQRTMAAAIAASAIATANIAQAQTTGGGIGANVNSNPGPSGLPTQGTTGAGGGTATSGVAAPNAPSSPVRPGSGPGINNTGSPVLSTPGNLRTPIGGSPGRTPGGTAKIPGNAVPTPPPRTTRGLNGATVPQPTTAPQGTAAGSAARPGLSPATVPNVAANRPAANLRTGVITNFSETSISFREGANTNDLAITPDTVVQMDGRNISLRDIPVNAQVRIERSPRSANTVSRIVVVPPASSSTGGTSVNSQTGTGSTGSANRSLQDRASIGGFGGATNRTGAASSPQGSASQPANNSDISNRPLAPGQSSPTDQPLAPFTRGPEQRLQAGFDEPAAQNQQNQPQPVTDSSQFLGPATGAIPPKPGSDGSGSRSGPRADMWTGAVGSRMGIQMNDGSDGLTIGNVSDQSLAARSGFEAGDRIQSINGTNVSTAADFGRALQSAGQAQSPITANVLRDGTLQTVNLTLPNGFFNGITIPPVDVAGAASIGTAPVVSTGAGNIGVTADGTAGVNVGGVFVPAEGGVAGGTGGPAAAAGAAAVQSVQTQQGPVVQGQAAARVRPEDPPVGTQRQGVTTEALKVPDVDLGWTLKATPEGVVMSSIVDNGLASKNKLQPGDIIESIDGRPITAPGAVSYELHRHRAGANVEFGILRNGQRMKEAVILPESHKPLLLNRNETFGQANNDAKEQGGSGARPIPVKPTEESIRRLEAENQTLREELERLKKSK